VYEIFIQRLAENLELRVDNLARPLEETQLTVQDELSAGLEPLRQIRLVEPDQLDDSRRVADGRRDNRSPLPNPPLGDRQHLTEKTHILSRAQLAYCQQITSIVVLTREMGDQVIDRLDTQHE
jgi:hypothetical protein